MRIEHVAMYVEDLEGAKNFFEKYFLASASKKYINSKNCFSSYFLSFDSGSRLEIMKKETIEKENLKEERLGLIHIAFSVGSKEKVNEITKRLVEDGYELKDGPRKTGDGYFESKFIIEDNIIEITI